MSAKIWQKISNLKSQTYVDLRFEIFCQIFADNFSNFFWSKNFRIFLNSKKNIIFSELRKIFWYSFDVKLSDLSIYDVFRAFGVRQIWFPAPTRYCEGTKTCSISRIFWILVRIDRFRRYFSSCKQKSKFFSAKKIFFSELRKKFGYVFDVKISNLSIYDVFSAFWAL